MTPEESRSPRSAQDPTAASDPRGDDPADHAGTGESSPSSPWPRRLGPYVVGVLLVTMPALTLVAAYAVLAATRSALIEGLTPVEVVELYLVELVMFAVFGYLLYRLTLFGVRRQVLADAGSTEAASTDEGGRPSMTAGRTAAGGAPVESEPVESEPREAG
jgi:hypothetical protein